VAEQVLVDRSTARITTGQRISLNSVEEAAVETRDGATYWVFEHVSQVGGRAGRWVGAVSGLSRVGWPDCFSCCGGLWMAVAAGRRPMEGGEVQCVACMLVDSRLTVAAVGSLLQGSPTLRTLARETYRHSLAVTGGLGGWQPAVTAACRNCRRRLPLLLPLSTAAAAGARRLEFGAGHACCLTVPACLPAWPACPACVQQCGLARMAAPSCTP
jgi:hypothetical protein